MPGTRRDLSPLDRSTRSSELSVGGAVDVDERTAVCRPAAGKEIIALAREQAFGRRARIAWLRHEMADAVALGEIGETQPVPRPHRRAVESFGGDREKRRVVETIDPDIPTPVVVDDNGKLPAVRRQARCPERPRLDRDWRGDARTIGPHQRPARGRRLRPEHQRAGRRQRETPYAIARVGIDTIEQFHGRAGHRESTDVESDGEQVCSGDPYTMWPVGEYCASNPSATIVRRSPVASVSTSIRNRASPS